MNFAVPTDKGLARSEKIAYGERIRFTMPNGRQFDISVNTEKSEDFDKYLLVIDTGMLPLAVSGEVLGNQVTIEIDAAE